MAHQVVGYISNGVKRYVVSIVMLLCQ